MIEDSLNACANMILITPFIEPPSYFPRPRMYEYKLDDRKKKLLSKSFSSKGARVIHVGCCTHSVVGVNEHPSSISVGPISTVEWSSN